MKQRIENLLSTIDNLPWNKLVTLIQSIFLTGNIPQKMSWEILILIPKNESKFRGMHGDLEKDTNEFDNWSICISHRTVRTFVAHTTKRRRRLKQLDFVATYLQARMCARIFLCLQSEYANYFSALWDYFYIHLLLKRTLYGLTVSSKYWNDELVDWLKNNNFGNFSQSTADQSLFSYENGQKWIRFIFYVYDGLYYGDSDTTEKCFFDEMSKRFHVENKV